MTWKIILSIVLWVVVGFGQGFVVETLPPLPSHTSIKTIGTTAKGEVSLLAMTETGYVGLWYSPKTGWAVNGPPKNVIFAVPITWEKINEDGSLFQTNILSRKDEVFVSVGFPPKYMLGYNLPQTAARFSSTAVLIPCVGLIDNYLYPTSIRGEFPSLDGKIYYSALNTRKNTVGIYSYNGNPQVADCSLKEEFLTDPSFDLGQVWKEKSGTFLVERFPRPAKSMETEIVRISPNGDSTILISSSQPAQITTAVCCEMVYDPDNWHAIMSYQDKDKKYHVVNDQMKEIYSATRWNLRPVALKGSYALLATNEYLGTEVPGKFDSFVLVNIETRESWTVYGPTTVPGIVKAAVNPFWASIDALGSTYILLADPKDSTKDRVVKISFPPLPPLLTPRVETLGTVAPEGTVVVTGVGLIADKATTTIIINGTEVPTVVENSVVTFTAPTEPGEYTVTVRVMNISETIESEKMTLVVSADPLYRVGTIQEIVSIYSEADSPAPNKIMVLNGQDLCTAGDSAGCVLRIGGITSTLQSVKTDENRSTITFVVPSELSLGQQTVIVEKISAEGTLINRSKPFVTEIVASAPTFLRLPDDPSYFLIQNEKGIVNGDNPANTGENLTGWVTGRGTEKFILTIDDREVAYEIISDERIGLEQIRFVMPETIWYGSNVKFAPPEKIFWFNTNPPPPPIPVVE